MMDLIDIGKRIKSLRKDSNLTQSKVAEFSPRIMFRGITAFLKRLRECGFSPY